jgi:hypothetical protein
LALRIAIEIPFAMLNLPEREGGTIKPYPAGTYNSGRFVFGGKPIAINLIQIKEAVPPPYSYISVVGWTMGSSCFSGKPLSCSR